MQPDTDNTRMILISNPTGFMHTLSDKAVVGNISIVVVEEKTEIADDSRVRSDM